MSHPTHISPEAPTSKVLDETNFELLYRAYWKDVFRICYYYVQDEELAADLSQNVFEMVWKKRNVLQAGEGINHYLCRAAKLEAQGFCRSQSLHRLHEKNLLEAQPRQAPSTTEIDVLYRDLQGRVNHLLRELPSKSEYIYRLSHEQGLDNKRISEQVSLSVKSVEYHLYKVLNFLREHLSSQ